MTNEQIGQRIRNRRNEIGMSVESLAGIVGVNKSSISRYEKGIIEKLKLPVIESIAGALGVNPAWLIGKSDKMFADELPSISPDAHHIGVLYDRADEKDQLLTHSVLDKYEDENKIISINTKKKNPGGFTEIDVYDEPAAAGLGNYLDEPVSRREQMPAFMVPKGADFGIRISGDSMEPMIADGSVVFVKQSITVESGKVGVFVLNGASFCKQLIVDREKKQIRLHSVNPKYQDIIVAPEDTLITIGQVLYLSEK